MRKGHFYGAAIVSLIVALATDNAWVTLMCVFACGVFSTMGHVHGMMGSYKAAMSKYRDDLEEAVRQRTSEMNKFLDDRMAELAVLRKKCEDESLKSNGADHGKRNDVHNPTYHPGQGSY